MVASLKRKWQTTNFARIKECIRNPSPYFIIHTVKCSLKTLFGSFLVSYMVVGGLAASWCPIWWLVVWQLLGVLYDGWWFGSFLVSYMIVGGLAASWCPI